MRIQKKSEFLPPPKYRPEKKPTHSSFSTPPMLACGRFKPPSLVPPNWLNEPFLQSQANTKLDAIGAISADVGGSANGPYGGVFERLAFHPRPDSQACHLPDIMPGL